MVLLTVGVQVFVKIGARVTMASVHMNLGWGRVLVLLIQLVIPVPTRAHLVSVVILVILPTQNMIAVVIAGWMYRTIVLNKQE